MLGSGQGKRAERCQLPFSVTGKFRARRENIFWYFAVIF